MTLVTETEIEFVVMGEHRFLNISPSDTFQVCTTSIISTNSDGSDFCEGYLLRELYVRQSVLPGQRLRGRYYVTNIIHYITLTALIMLTHHLSLSLSDFRQ